MSQKKVNAVTRVLHGFLADEALMYLNALAVSRNLKAAKLSIDLLKSAIANGENNHGFDRRRMVVKRVFVGRAHKRKYIAIHARGKMGIKTHHRCHITFELEHIPPPLPPPRPKVPIVHARPDDRHATRRQELTPVGGWKAWRRKRIAQGRASGAVAPHAVR